MHDILVKKSTLVHSQFVPQRLSASLPQRTHEEKADAGLHGATGRDDTLRAFDPILSERQLTATKGDTQEDSLGVGTSEAAAGAFSWLLQLWFAHRT